MKRMTKLNTISATLVLLGQISLPVFANAEVATTSPTNTPTQIQNARQPLDHIIAVVNDNVITSTELNTQVNSIQKTLKQRHTPLPPKNILRRQVLEHMINVEIELQMAKQMGIELDSHDIDDAIGRIAQQNHISVDTLRQNVEAQGLTWKNYRQQIKKEMIISKLQQKAAGQILITDQQVNNFLTSNMGSSGAHMANNAYHLEDIVIPLPAEPSSQEVLSTKKRADVVLAKLKKGANFNELAVAESSGKNALQGGDLGFRQLAELPEAFASQVVSMKPGELAGPIRTANGWHIIKLVAIEGSQANGVPSKDQVRNLLYQRKYNENIENWLMRIRNNAYVKIY